MNHKMNCQQIEELISSFIENELSPEEHREVTQHLKECPNCRALKEEVEKLIYVMPELEEEVPFYLRNRLYYIPESQELNTVIESRFYFMKWVAAVVAGFAVMLSVIYFTNVFPAGNRSLHKAIAGIKTVTVETGAYFQKVAETKGEYLITSIFGKDKKDKDSDQTKDDEATSSESLHENNERTKDRNHRNGQKTEFKIETTQDIPTGVKPQKNKLMN